MTASGDIIGDKYRLQRQLGEGGMGAVWRAQHMVLKRSVAVKLIDPRGPDAPRTIQRFLREAQAAASIRDRNVVDVLDFGTTPQGKPFMVMELLEGVDLADRFAISPALTLEQFVQIIAATLGGLASVHAAGIIHRDIKPENIFLIDEAGSITPKLIDFGLSLDVENNGEKRSRSALTKDGVIIGTLEYMSPEQARGVRDIDVRSDLYSMGVILYRGISGFLPFDAENTGDLLVSVIRGGAEPVQLRRPDIGPALSRVVARAMAKERDERFATALDMKEALLAAAQETPSLRALSLPEPLHGAALRPMTPTLAADDIHGDGFDEYLRSSDQRSTSTGLRRSAELLVSLSRNRRTRMGLAIASVMGLLTIVLVLATQSRPASGEKREQAPPPAQSTPPSLPKTVMVQLRGVPDEATILVDSVPVSGPELELPRDEKVHHIEVRSPGKHPWTQDHAAVSGGMYDVLLISVDPPTTTSTDTSATRHVHGAGVRKRRVHEEVGRNRVVRDPGF